MQHIKNLTSGIKKNADSGSKEKDYDLDRRRDSRQNIETTSQEAEKTIFYFDSDELDLFQNIEADKATHKWVNDGEVQIILPKKTNSKPMVWERLMQNHP